MYKTKHYNDDDVSRLISYRTRCPFCLSKPTLYVTTNGLSYNDNVSNLSRVILYSRVYVPYKRIFRVAGDLMKSVSFRKYSSWWFKKHRDELGRYRILVTCNCNKSIWMFYSGDNFVSKNKKNPRKFVDRYIKSYMKKRVNEA